MIESKTALKKCIRDAEVAASLLRTPGHRFHGVGERERVAQLLMDLSNIARRMFDVRGVEHMRDRAEHGPLTSTADVGDWTQAELDDLGVAQ